MGRCLRLILALPFVLVLALMCGFAGWWGTLRRRDERTDAPEPITHEMTEVAPEDESEDERRRWCADLTKRQRLDKSEQWWGEQMIGAGVPLEPVELWHAKRLAAARRN